MKDSAPNDFADAVDFDSSIRHCVDMRGDMFLHRDCVPLRDVDLRTQEEAGQVNMFNNECEGMCGV